VTLGFVDVTLPRPYAPPKNAFGAPFWHALAAGRFTTTRCAACGAATFPPRPICPHCHAARHEWIELDGRGRLYSATRIHAAGGAFAAFAPYSVGLVDLDEGIRVLTRLLPSASALPLDSRVQLVVLRHPDGPLFAATAS
jgi:uncharacterized OB-fold protein